MDSTLSPRRLAGQFFDAQYTLWSADKGDEKVTGPMLLKHYADKCYEMANDKACYEMVVPIEKLFSDLHRFGLGDKEQCRQAIEALDKALLEAKAHSEIHWDKLHEYAGDRQVLERAPQDVPQVKSGRAAAEKKNWEAAYDALQADPIVTALESVRRLAEDVKDAMERKKEASASR